jgi:ribonuclease BN (tRNA processing enzyme)
VRIRFAGSGDAFGSGGRYQTCIWVTNGSYTLLVDCGATSMVALKAQRLEPDVVDAVVLTHLHGDHFAGLPFLILDGQFSGRTRPLTVAGPPGTRARLRDAMEALFPGSSQVPRRFRVQVLELALDGRPVRLGEASVRGWEVVHPSGAPPLACSVSLSGVTFSYSGDTQWTPALIDAARGADLFAVEAYTFQRQIRYHLNYRTVREHLTELRAGRIVLTHMSADMLANVAAADLPAAYDGMVIDI